MYGTGFATGSLARVRTRDGTWGSGIKVGSDKELTEVGKMMEYDLGGGQRSRLLVQGSDNVVT